MLQLQFSLQRQFVGSMPTDDVSPSSSAGGGDANGGRLWAPHGQALTACLVALNVLIVFLIYIYFWHFFSRKGAAAPADWTDDTAESSAASSPGAASPKAQNRQEVERAITALPVFVHSSSSSRSADNGGGKAAAECAICIAEFVDGEEGRLLPRCGHRYHGRCVDLWFHFHTTCPLCRASVLPAADAAAAEQENQPPETNSTDMDCPV